MSIVRAEQLFRAFFRRDPEAGDIHEIAMREPEIALVIGTLDGLIYSTEDGDKPFIHRFKKSDRPLLLVSSDGRQLYALKGAYRFTERGFVG